MSGPSFNQLAIEHHELFRFGLREKAFTGRIMGMEGLSTALCLFPHSAEGNATRDLTGADTLITNFP